MQTSEFVDNWVAIESRRIKQFIITLKKRFQNVIFSLKPYLILSYRTSIIMADIGQVCRRPVLHDLDLLPYYNISSASSYFPEWPIDKNQNR